jgi:hypothetical protein
VRISKSLAVLTAVIAVLVLADVGIVALRLTSGHPTGSAPAGASAAAGHPCNHGSYVSRAAHAHKGGGYVSSVAKSKLGKSGGCSAPVPAPAGAGEGD